MQHFCSFKSGMKRALLYPKFLLYAKAGALNSNGGEKNHPTKIAVESFFENVKCRDAIGRRHIVISPFANENVFVQLLLVFGYAKSQKIH